ncbi:MAG: hypothetical protein KKF85_08940 [Gammaproteobacteria bacterium]|nr:hypothetical protein [Rhodocyclaceae bacterium]MBU3910667.1 hypothetical protein [Gammaproteobacteria bacterium]MBU3989910.1 hypothetical protein [Gammaproteobacteria bacterium]MBU4005129.1 hypothetical protein [Gammaproteobacteria bacterium]MBU4021021.1 hypothetical protein [Gammaproteobacteria bacterium]
MKQPFVVSTLIAAMLLSAGFALTANAQQAQTQQQEQVYGSQMMTQQERNEYRARMRAAKTLEEQQQIRLQHHEAMKVRAKAQGITLPDEPPAMGGGMGPGGGGMGPGGGGMGPGGGRGR